VGQFTNEVAKKLSIDGLAEFFCVTGVGARISGMIESVRGARKVLVLDGCSAQCAKKCADQAGISGYSYLVVTDLGIEKNHDFSLAQADIDRVLSACKANLTSTA